MLFLLSLLANSVLADTVTGNQQQDSNIKQYTYEVVNIYPHDPSAFTQGLIYQDGHLYESTGLNGRSSLRKIELETGKVLKKKKINRKYFGEGLASDDGYLVQLSWRAGTGFVYNRDTFALKKTFNYPGEGWGLTTYKGHLIMSDGSSTLRFLDPVYFKEIRQLQVTIDGKPLKKINELEMVKGNIYANVWRTDQIVIISPVTGRVEGIANLAGLLNKAESSVTANVLNGIAYDATADRLFVTGKFWPKLFEIKLVPSD
jgi:glutaminyl-peptide cyclotransferase